MATAYFVGCFAAFAAVVLSSHQPPLFMDYPDWVYQGVLFGKLLSGHPVPGYALKAYPIPNTITTVGIGVLSLVFGWALAAKLWIVFYLSVACATCLYMGKTLRIRENALWWILPGVLFFSRNFGLGTVNFDLGVCLFLLLICALYRQDERGWVLAGLLVLIFFAHFVTYAAALLIVVLYCSQHRRWKPLQIAASTLPLAAWYAIGRGMANDKENMMGSSPPAHLVPLVVAASAFLITGILFPRQPRLKVLVYSLFTVTSLIVLGAFATMFQSASAIPLHLRNAIILVQDKLVDPLSFGLVRITANSHMTPGLSSSADAGLHQLPEAAYVCTVITGILIFIAGVRSLREISAKTDDDSTKGNFIWELSALMTLLYLICPPNVLGVMGIDLRLAEIALGPMLFLLARKNSSLLRWGAVATVVFTLANLYQFDAWQKGLRLPGTLFGLPPAVVRCCEIQPWVRMNRYDHLRKDQLDEWVFPTGIFMNEAHQPDDPPI